MSRKANLRQQNETMRQLPENGFTTNAATMTGKEDYIELTAKGKEAGDAINAKLATK